MDYHVSNSTARRQVPFQSKVRSLAVASLEAGQVATPKAAWVSALDLPTSDTTSPNAKLLLASLS
jgi:hypothetical protein